MPLYEYHCSKCGKIFEVMQKFSDAALTVHAGCGGQVERLISASAFQFKGSGWYATDYAKGQRPSKTDGKEPDSKPAEGKPAESKSDGKGSGGETKTESKPVTTTTKTES